MVNAARARARTHTHTHWRQNFVVNAAQAQLNGELVGADGAPTATARRLDLADAAFTFVFAAELSLNAYAHWCFYIYISFK